MPLIPIQEILILRDDPAGPGIAIVLIRRRTLPLCDRVSVVDITAISPTKPLEKNYFQTPSTAVVTVNMAGIILIGFDPVLLSIGQTLNVLEKSLDFQPLF